MLVNGDDNDYADDNDDDDDDDDNNYYHPVAMSASTLTGKQSYVNKTIFEVLIPTFAFLVRICHLQYQDQQQDQVF